MTREEIINLEDAENEQERTKMIRVPMPTFPPTAMVYSVNKVPPPGPPGPAPTPPNNDQDAVQDSVPTTLIAKVLTQDKPARKPRRVYICSKCTRDAVFEHKATQTPAMRCTEHAGVSPPPPGVSSSWVCRGQQVGTGAQVHRTRLNSTETEI